MPTPREPDDDTQDRVRDELEPPASLEDEETQAGRVRHARDEDDEDQLAEGDLFDLDEYDADDDDLERMEGPDA